MIRGQDIVVLLSLVGLDDRFSIRELAADVALPPASTHRSLTSLEQARLYDRRRRRVPLAAAEEFLVHAVKYMFAAHMGTETRGIAAAWAAEPLVSALAPTGELPPVWPDPAGTVRGLALEPLHPVAIAAAGRDPVVARRLALVDTLRAGDARLREIAVEALLADLRGTAR